MLQTVSERSSGPRSVGWGWDGTRRRQSGGSGNCRTDEQTIKRYVRTSKGEKKGRDEEKGQADDNKKTRRDVNCQTFKIMKGDERGEKAQTKTKRAKKRRGGGDRVSEDTISKKSKREMKLS